jgi:hypothetical protein
LTTGTLTMMMKTTTLATLAVLRRLILKSMKGASARPLVDVVGTLDTNGTGDLDLLMEPCRSLDAAAFLDVL